MDLFLSQRNHKIKVSVLKLKFPHIANTYDFMSFLAGYYRLICINVCVYTLYNFTYVYMSVYIT